jgi:Methylase involved in ubiquinone/menaquinone biosynthesis
MTQSPIACDMTAIPTNQRQAHLATSRELFSRIEEFRELANGYEFRFTNEAKLLLKLVEFISLEKLCCPFLSFVIEVEPEGGPVWLRLTGREGVKAFIREEISLQDLQDSHDLQDKNPVNPVKVLNEWRDTAQYWVKHSAALSTMFAPLTQALIEQAGIREGQSVLDIAGGAGEPSLTIAGVVAPSGLVTCTDAVPEMVEAAQSEAKRQGVENIQFRVCTADSLPFPDNSFDAVVSRLGMMFFPDSLAAMREMMRVTKPGGTLALAVWHKSELNPFCHLVSNVIEQHVQSPAADPDAPGAFRFAEPGKLASVMTRAGVGDVVERVIKFDIAAPISALEFWTIRSQVSETLRSKLAKLPPDEQAEVSREVEQSVSEFFPDNQMKFPAQMIIVSGKKPL